MKLRNFLKSLNNKYVLSLLGNGVMSIIGMVISIILRRVFSLEDMGIWLLFFSVILLVDTFRTGFLTTAFIKFFAGAEAQKAREIVGSTWYLAILITGILLLLNIPAYFISFHVENLGVALFLKWFGIAYVLSLPFFVTSCILQAKQRFDQLLFIRLFNQGSFVIFILLFIFFKRINITTVIYSYLLSNAVSSMISMLRGWSMINDIRMKTKESISTIYHFGKFSVGTNISATLLGTADSLIINFVMGPAALAIYDAGIKFIQFIEIPLRSFAATAMPALSTAFNNNKRMEVIDITKKYIGMVTIAIVPITIGTLIFADYAILILGGEKYVHTIAPNILRIVMIIALFYPADRFLALTLDVIHKPKINFYKVMLMVVVTVVTDFAGIYLTNSLYGVITATIFPTLTAIFIGYYALQKNYEKFGFWDIFSSGYQEMKYFLSSQYKKYFN
ncbi:Membrane protein involved in the export of O-antigen and teichoic acid [Pedobacter steynii]|uniref:Membrane protein involved in the export of O-antigen and teichoic acid n=1 Tax=Pedobacter steynii TaxID=430522 RepID=A0A1G9KKX6_9SPHI|nr:oligosaccharide flippase family protein [Pedobacter steynii]NQX38581.1 oligosaccharide flippase family protein [Pedobacter steynii]SDL50302.1 Membrane protein involved in the export of O-antigen and teichoic acid [Pedobacter steynii]